MTDQLKRHINTHTHKIYCTAVILNIVIETNFFIMRNGDKELWGLAIILITFHRSFRMEWGQRRRKYWLYYTILGTIRHGRLTFGTASVTFCNYRVHIIGAISTLVPHILIADAILSKFTGCLALRSLFEHDEKRDLLHLLPLSLPLYTLLHFVTGRWEQFDISFSFIHDVFYYNVTVYRL